MNPYRDAIVRGYRFRLIKSLTKDDLFDVFRDIGKKYPGSLVEARKQLLDHWDDQIQRLIWQTVERNLRP